MEGFMVLFIIAGLMAIIPAWVAASKGRSFVAFWWFGFFLWLPALIVSICIKDNAKAIGKKECKSCYAVIDKRASKCCKCGGDTSTS